MKVIKIKGHDQLLCFRDEIPPSEFEDREVTWKVTDHHNVVKEYIRENNNIRIVVAKGVPDWAEAYILYVYWHNQNDIGNFDEKVEHHTVTDENFANTLVVEFDEYCCLGSCGSWWYVLNIPRGFPFAADPSELNWNELKNPALTIKKCPQCGGEFRQPVVFILGKSREQESQELEEK